MPDAVVHRVDTLEALDAFCGLAQQHRGEWLCFDLETRSDGGGKRNLEDWHPSSRIGCVSFSWTPDEAWVVPLSHPAAPWHEQWVAIATELFQWIADLSPQLVNANLKYDVRWVLSRTGIDLTPFMAWDTINAAFLLDENQALGLKVRAVADVGVEPWGGVDLSDCERCDWTELSQYNGLDTANAFRLHLWQREQHHKDPKLGTVLWHILRPAAKALVHIEHNGMLLDPDENERLRAECRAEHTELYHQFESMIPANIAVKYQPTVGADRLFDVGEPTAKERFSLAPTSKFFMEYAESRWPVLATSEKTGKPSWDKSVMKQLARRGHEDAAVLLKYRQLDKLLTTYLDRWPVDAAVDGRLHPTYKTTRIEDGDWTGGTITGRLACENPNLQQVAKKAKTVFVAPPGWVFVQADQSQIEVRLLAHVSGDENLRNVYRNGQDVYVMTGAAMYSVDPGKGTKHESGEVTKDMRGKAKPAVLGYCYGMLPPTYTRYARDVFDIDITLDEAEDTHSAFFGLYPGLLDYHERQRRRVRQQGYVRSMFGRIRRLPEIKSRDQQKRWSAERKAINAPIQSAGSDLMLLALAAIHENVSPDECRQVGTVHDSDLMLWREDKVDELLPVIAELMVNPDLSLYGPALTIPLAVEFEIGPRWGAPERTVEVTGRVAAQELAA